MDVLFYRTVEKDQLLNFSENVLFARIQQVQKPLESDWVLGQIKPFQIFQAFLFSENQALGRLDAGIYKIQF